MVARYQSQSDSCLLLQCFYQLCLWAICANILFLSHRDLLNKPRSELTYVFIPTRFIQSTSHGRCWSVSINHSNHSIKQANTNHRVWTVNMKSASSKNTSSQPDPYPSSKQPLAPTHKSSSHAATTANCSHAWKRLIVTAIWSWRMSRRCGLRSPRVGRGGVLIRIGLLARCSFPPLLRYSG